MAKVCIAGTRDEGVAETYGFKTRLCRPYSAKTKGKVGRFNLYLKGCFIVLLAATIEATGLPHEADVANALYDAGMTKSLMRGFTQRRMRFQRSG